MTKYSEFIERKTQIGTMDGFKPLWMPDFLFDFQKALVDWAIRKGRSAIFADCGLGKTPMQLVWAENIVRKTKELKPSYYNQAKRNLAAAVRERVQEDLIPA